MSKLIVQGQKVEVTEAMEAHAKEQFERVFNHFENFIVEDVTLRLGVNVHPSHITTASVLIPVRGNDISIEVTGDEMYKTITEVARKAERQLRKHKEKNNPRTGIDKRTVLDDE